MIRKIIGEVHSGKTLTLIHYLSEALKDGSDVTVFLEETGIEKFKSMMYNYLKSRNIEMENIVGIVDISDLDEKAVLDKIRDRSDVVCLVDSWKGYQDNKKELEDICSIRTLAFYMCINTGEDNIGVSDICVDKGVGKDVRVTPMYNHPQFLLNTEDFFNLNHICYVDTIIKDDDVSIEGEDNEIMLIQAEVDKNHYFNFVSIGDDHEYIKKFIGRRVKITIETID